MSQKNTTQSEIVVLQSVPSHQQLMKTNRWLLKGVFFLMTVIFIGGFLLLPDNDFLANYQKVTAADVAADSNPQLSAEVNTLKGQVVGLVSGSIESKLRSLEESLLTGTLNASLGTIEDLKNEVKILRTYSEPAKPASVASVSNVQLMQEMSQLKRLVYWTLASCSLMVAAVAGIWVRNIKKLPLKENIIRYFGRH
ncbi:MAG: hypothetical protein PHH59_09480 [Methylovulum sp.]|uniref:hypothetical protein n=1 Tax=Methylovulum sp. TaxID=1916980 RepID=UPI00261A709D|nr:hypothetical protein [Methylovulum sp.]MDD2724235.1 hypothetical protein [Methylovulum sp.]MDD5123032.1 hypothetical protein [Methylovulum sp.]